MNSIKKFFSVKMNIIISCIIAALIMVGVTTGIILKNKNNNSCLIQFNTNGGTIIENQSIICGNTINKPLDPVKNKFNFIGWYLDNQSFDFNTTINNNIILNAKWESDGSTEIFTVSFDSNGGTSIDKIEVAKGNSITEPISPVKKGYSFKGWYYNNELFDFSFFINEDMTLIAKWEKNNEKNTNNTPTNNSNNNTEAKVTKKDESNEIKNTINNLKGKWYCDEDLDNEIYIEGADSYISGKKAFELNWSSIDLYNAELFPKHSYGASYYLYYDITSSDLKQMLNSLNITFVSSNKLVINNKYHFSRNKKTIDYSQYEKYLGTWYRVSGTGDDEINITKECNIESPCYRIGNYTAEGISNKAIKDKTTVFDKYTKWSGNNLIIGNGVYSKTKPKEIIKLNSVVFFFESSNCTAGDKIKADIRFNPENASDKSGVWSSTNNSVASVDQNGNVSCLKGGYANIKFTSSDGGLTSENTIWVKDTYLNKINLSQSEIWLKVGEEKTINYSFVPSFASDKSFDFEAESGSGVNGFINEDKQILIFVGESSGTKIFTLKQNNKDLARITVHSEVVPVSNIRLENSEITVYKGDSFRINYTVEPSNATNKKVIIRNGGSNYKILDVYSDGKIVAKSKGTTSVYVTTEDGTISSECRITVKTKPLKGSGTLLQGQTCFNTTCNNYLIMRLTATDGNDPYKYSYKLYNDNTLVFEETDIYQKEKTYNFSTPGTYRLEYSITDSDNITINGQTEAKHFELMTPPQ